MSLAHNSIGREFYSSRLQPSIVYSAEKHFENLFVTAIATVLVVRLFLDLLGYPALGGGNLHIAHMLWGGLCMVLSIVIAILFLGDRPRNIAATLGGVGCGLFIDEIGKFLTKDNDYFFKPTAMIIYGFFVGLWFLFRWLYARRSQNKSTVAANVLELIQEGTLYGFNQYERQQLQYHLQLLKVGDRYEQQIKNLADIVYKNAKSDSQGVYWYFSSKALKVYKKLISSPYFYIMLYGAFALQAVFSVLGAVDYIDMGDGDSIRSQAAVGQIIGGFVYTILILRGVYKNNQKKHSGFESFKTALLWNVFVTQFFAFYSFQFSAAFGLMLNLILLGGVDFLISHQNRQPRVAAR